MRQLDWDQNTTFITEKANWRTRLTACGMCGGGACATLGPGTEDNSAQLPHVCPTPHSREQAQVHALRREADSKDTGLGQVWGEVRSQQDCCGESLSTWKHEGGGKCPRPTQS